jgi:hypothetical protein
VKWATLAVIAALLATSCGQREEGRGSESPRSPDETPASPPVAGGDETPPPEALTFAEGTPERDLTDFCETNLHKMVECFDEPAFWEIFATMFFASNPAMDDGTRQLRELWIGMRKDDLLKFQREEALRDNCEIMVRWNRWPTPATIRRVQENHAGSCAPFANAFAHMIFVEGAFSARRGGEP